MLSQAFRDASYEVLPFKSTEEKVLAHVPKDVKLTVTTTEAKGLEPTLNLAERLSRAGYDAAPHLAARLVRDRSHLADLMDRLRAENVRSVFVIGGDAPKPVGEFADAASLLKAVHEMGRSFDHVGVGGYPEGHALIADNLLEQSLDQKAQYATHIISQLCFDASVTTTWAKNLHERGVDLPVRVGIPGAIHRQKLIRVSAGLGLGQSARFLSKQQNVLWRFFMPGGFSPDRLIKKLAPELARTGTPLAGFHVFTFNDLESTESWRQAWIRRLK